MIYEYQNHLTEPPMPVGGYLPKTISDEELKKIIKNRTEMCMAILNGDEKESGKTAQLIAEAYKQGFQEGLKAAKNKPDAHWIKKQVDYRHYHYFCSKCGCCSKYKKSNYCPDCGRKMQKGEKE